MRTHVRSSLYMNHNMRFPAIWYVRPAKAQTSLRIRAVWSEPLLVAWIFYEYWATDWTSFEVPKLKRVLRKLVWVYTCQNVTLSKITCQNVTLLEIKGRDSSMPLNNDDFLSSAWMFSMWRLDVVKMFHGIILYKSYWCQNHSRRIRYQDNHWVIYVC